MQLLKKLLQYKKINDNFFNNCGKQFDKFIKNLNFG